jgi:hypothetical protein
MAPWNGQQLVKKAIFSGTKRDCKIQDNMGGNGLGNRCSALRHAGPCCMLTAPILVMEQHAISKCHHLDLSPTIRAFAWAARVSLTNAPREILR